jgi:proline dehydrogenase
MLRSILIYLSKAEWARKLVMGFAFARRTALRFVAGETLDEAIEVVRDLNKKGMLTTLDHLGEDTDSPEQARQATDDIIAVLDAIHSAAVRSNVSIKLTQIGLNLTPELCSQNLERILQRAKELDTFVRIDMEDSPVIDVTLQIYRRMRAKGFDNVGKVLQSYLYRTKDDAHELLAEGTRIRLVKGAYDEPPEVAFPKKADADACFDEITTILMEAAAAVDAPLVSPDGHWPPIPSIATHDEKRIEHAKQIARQFNLPGNKYEFQMLHGIRRELQERLVEEGHTMRIYVPYGTEWYPYFMRRLAERPANVWFFLSNLFRR